MNPLLEPWTGPFGTPPLDRIKPEHFAPAYAEALSRHDDEIERIARETAPPDFANTVIALERSGELLARVDAVFSAFTGSATNEILQAIELEIAPRLSAHFNGIYLNAQLFARLDAVWRQRAALGLDPESRTALERIHLDFVRAGARLSPQARARMDVINQRLATLATEFSQNVLADEEDYVEPLTEIEIAGADASLRTALAATARERGLEAPYASLAPEMWVPPPENWYLPEGPIPRLLTASGFFNDVVHRGYVWRRRYSAGSFAAYIGTRSDHLRLPTERRENLLASIEASLPEEIDADWVTNMYVAAVQKV